MPDVYDTLHDLYSKHKESFAGQYHSTLWQVMINKTCTGAFTARWDDHLVIAQVDGGYIPCTCAFKEGITDDQQQVILNDLNDVVFDLTELAADMLIKRSHAEGG